MRDKIIEHYSEESRRLRSAVQRRKSRDKWFVAAEISLFVAAVALAVAFLCGSIGVAVFIPTFSFSVALFMATKVADRQNTAAMEKAEALLGVADDNMAYMSGDYSKFDDGARYSDPDHQYAYDMDLFGTASLYQRMCRTVTTGGADRLAHILSSSALPFNAEPAVKASDVMLRRRAIVELAAKEEWRNCFMATGAMGVVDTAALLKAVADTRAAGIPTMAMSRGALAAVAGSLVVFVALLLLTLFTPLSADFVCLWALMQLFVSISVSAKAINLIVRHAGSISKSAKGVARLMRLVCGERFAADANKAVTESLGGDSQTALKAVEELGEILDSIDRRGNVLGLIVFNALGFSDFFLVRRYLLWQSLHLESFATWIDAVCDIDAHVSMATMRYNEPSAVDAEVSDEDGMLYEASGIYHPFLGEKAVRNDFTIADGNFYIITGANMAGKSTFLRSLGINYVLAMCGMPVFAGRLRVSVFNLFSSMRTSDDLTRGISYFNAELLRLERLLDCVGSAPRTLLILDEILKGTNSLDKLNGSRMFLQAVEKRPVSGVIATHDLELSKMAEESSARFHNYCFEIKLQSDITYSYKITPGVARNQNATYLLRRMLEKDGAGR